MRGRVPLYVLSRPGFLGIDPDRSLVQLSTSDRKEITKLISQPRTFLILAISNLARSCTLVNQSDQEPRSVFALGTLDFVPLKEELELLQT